MKLNLDQDIQSRFDKEREEVFDKSTEKKNKVQIIVSIIVGVIILSSTLYQFYSYFRG
ncbi:hypothetical protein [Periweissella ghanensis]|uniref:Uncharacterized protein n=1 Tax=Periweissella ghanensis TaxID=467997 RepID=A0ABN8BRY6_9LACO|nr:hypothetical protein [Periweissella ghanensis]MCM0600071.1 hypothetical protein [Periweissella ghanensis]CAH0418971.1 hypothetical protein WGH24286_01414 [Periweissella ghanensis]